jgi:hypothetical protein
MKKTFWASMALSSEFVWMGRSTQFELPAAVILEIATFFVENCVKSYTKKSNTKTGTG